MVFQGVVCEGLASAIGLATGGYNCHSGMTPAQAAGIESNAWTVEELVKRCGE